MTSELEALAASLSQTVHTLCTELRSRQLPHLSSERDPPNDIYTSPVLNDARSRILDLVDELQALVLGPVGTLTLPPHNHLLSLQAICRFNIFAHVPLEDGSGIPYSELARIINVDENVLRRVLQHAITNRIFKHSKDGLVQHSVASKHLATNKNLRQWIGLVTEELWPSSTRTVDAIERWPCSQEPNETGFNLAFGTTRPFFEEIRTSQTRLQQFADAMGWQDKIRGTDVDQLAGAFDWNNLRDGLLVDIGGSDGTAALGLASRFRSLRCIVQDLPAVVNDVKRFQSEPTERVQFMAHDFFRAQPVHADVYLFRNILHDWSDKYACMILQALIPSLKGGSRILVNDYVLDEAHNDHSLRQRGLCAFDLSMLQLYNGRLRTLQQWRNLLGAANDHFQIHKYHQAATTRISLLEIVWTGN